MIDQKDITKILARKFDWDFGIHCLICHELNGKHYIGKVTFEELPQGNVIPADAHIKLNQTSAQLLMDELWNCGIRPSEGTGSAGSLKKTENHLEDMRKIVSKALKMEL